MTVRLCLPAALRSLAGGSRVITVDCAGNALAEVLDRIAVEQPALARRIRDEQGRLRRYVNIYIDGTDVRTLAGIHTLVPEGAEILVLPSVAGGCS